MPVVLAWRATPAPSSGRRVEEAVAAVSPVSNVVVGPEGVAVASPLPTLVANVELALKAELNDAEAEPTAVPPVPVAEANAVPVKFPVATEPVPAAVVETTRVAVSVVDSTAAESTVLLLLLSLLLVSTTTSVAVLVLVLVLAATVSLAVLALTSVAPVVAAVVEFVVV